MKSIAFIGDIHGEAALLEQLLANLTHEDNRHFVFLGDYVNLGPNSRRVIDLLTDLKNNWNGGVTCLLGNHDLVLLDYIRNGHIQAFAATGGIQTIASYVDYVEEDVYPAFIASLPRRHLLFLESLQSYFEGPDVFASHSGIDPNNPSDRSLTTMAGGGSFLALRHKTISKFLICGHFIQYSFVPYMTDWSACIDTGCGTAGGPLTALLWPEKFIVRADPYSATCNRQ